MFLKIIKGKKEDGVLIKNNKMNKDEAIINNLLNNNQIYQKMKKKVNKSLRNKSKNNWKIKNNKKLKLMIKICIIFD